MKSKIDNEVRYTIQDPENSDQMLKKLFTEIEEHQIKVKKIKENIKNLTFSNWNYKLSRRTGQKEEKIVENLKKQQKPEEFPLGYLAILTFGIVLFLFSVFRGIQKDSSFQVL